MRCCRWEAESAPPPLALRSHEREGTWRGLLPLAAAQSSPLCASTCPLAWLNEDLGDELYPLEDEQVVEEGFTFSFTNLTLGDFCVCNVKATAPTVANLTVAATGLAGLARGHVASLRPHRVHLGADTSGGAGITQARQEGRAHAAHGANTHFSKLTRAPSTTRAWPQAYSHDSFPHLSGSFGVEVSLDSRATLV